MEELLPSRVDEKLETWEDGSSFRTPDRLLHSFSEFHDLTHFVIASIPFLAQDMALRLIVHALEIRKLRLLSLNLKSITSQPHHNLVLPSLGILADISANHTCLSFLRITLSFANVPKPVSGQSSTVLRYDEQLL